MNNQDLENETTPVGEIKIYLIYDSSKGPQRRVEIGEKMNDDEFLLGVRAVLKKENNAVIEHDEFCVDLTPKSTKELNRIIEKLSEKAKEQVLAKADVK